MKKTDIPKYLKAILKEYPKVSSGRKNYTEHHQRLIKTINIIKNYFKK